MCADHPPLCSKRHTQRGSSCCSASADAPLHHDSGKEGALLHHGSSEGPLPQPDAVDSSLPAPQQAAAAAVSQAPQVSQAQAAAAVRRAHSRQLPAHLQQLKLHLVHCLLGPRSNTLPAGQPESAALAAGHAAGQPELRPESGAAAAVEAACLSRSHSGEVLDIAAGCEPAAHEQQVHVVASGSLQACRLSQQQGQEGTMAQVMAPQQQQALPRGTLGSGLGLNRPPQVPVQAAVEACRGSISPTGHSMACPGRAAGCSASPWPGSGQAGWPEGQAAAQPSPGVALSTGLGAGGSCWGVAEEHGRVEPQPAWPVAAAAAPDLLLVDAACHMLDMAAHAVGTQLLQATAMLC